MRKAAKQSPPARSPAVQPYEKNPRYLEYRGKPILAVGASEHYGAVLNSDFDYIPYLEELARQGLNYVRIFSGVYRELPDSTNTLAPREEAFLCPWKRLEGTESITPGLVNGDFPHNPTWDVKLWEERYWERLVHFCQEAQRRNILVEFVLFHQAALALPKKRDCHFASPLYFGNQKNSPILASSFMAYWHYGQEYQITIRGPEWAECRNEYLPFMESFVRKAIEKLAMLENVFFCVLDDGSTVVDVYDNVAWTEEWQRWCCDLLQQVAPERMIAVHWQNRTALIENLHPAVKIASFHEALPSAALANYHLRRVIASSETSDTDNDLATHRQSAWRFFFSGGGLFCHLDRSFSVEQPGGGAGRELREQLGYLRLILQENQLWGMRPASEYLVQGNALVMTDEYDYLVYLPRAGSVVLTNVSVHRCEQLWFDPVGCRLSDAPHRSPKAVKNGVRFSPPSGLKEAVLVLKNAGHRYRI